MIVAVCADDAWPAMLSGLADSNGLASAVLMFMFVVMHCCHSLTMS